MVLSLLGHAAAGSQSHRDQPPSARDYDILDTVECGIVLQGSEVKSLREAHVQFADANGWIPTARRGSRTPHRPVQAMRGRQRGTTRTVSASSCCVATRYCDSGRESIRNGWRSFPLSLYFKDGRVKVELALGKGRGDTTSARSCRSEIPISSCGGRSVTSATNSRSLVAASGATSTQCVPS